MIFARGLSVIAALDGCVAYQANAAETLESLAARIPAAANALVMIDVEQTMKAPLAIDQGWARPSNLSRLPLCNA